MLYITIELLIIATGVIIFIVGFCGFLQKWMQYVQELDEHGNKSNKGNKQDIENGKITKSFKCVLHSNCLPYETKDNPPSYSIELPPKYDEAIKKAQQQQQTMKNEQILLIQELPRVHTISETINKSTKPTEIV